MISSVIVTQASNLEFLIKLIKKLKAITDETVIILDNSDTEIYTKLSVLADKVKVIPNKGFYELYSPDILENASYEWILRLDDDEMVDDSWTKEILNKLTDDKFATHYWIPRRWLVNNEEYICTSPWFPDYQLRLFRNLPGIISLPVKVHQAMEITGEIRRIDFLFIDHYNLVLNDYNKRLKKAEFYMGLDSHNPCSLVYYIFENYKYDLGQLTKTEIRDRDICFPKRDLEYLNNEGCQAAVTEVRVSSVMTMGLTYTASVRLKNNSNRTFYPSNNVIPSYNKNIFVSYHIYKKTDNNFEAVSFDGERFALPSIFAPGEEIDVLLQIQPPLLEGIFYIQFDMVEEGVAWFSQKNDTKLYPLVEINIQNGFEISNTELKTMKKIFYLCTPEHGNIGDHAISIGTKHFLEDYFPDYFLIEYSSKEIYEYIGFIDSIINEEDVIFIPGGGNLGNRYMCEEDNRRFILKHFRHNKIISLPQTIYFSDDISGNKELLMAIEIYSNPNLLVIARDEKSYALLRKFFNGCKYYLNPDMFLYYSKYIKNETPAKPENDILVVLRSDTERHIDKEEIFSVLNECSYQYQVTDTNYDNPELSTSLAITKEVREYYVLNKLEEFKKSKIIITDRFHGIIFAILMKVPCIVFKSGDHKLEEGLKLISGNNNIIYLGEDYSLLSECIDKLLSTGETEAHDYDVKIFTDMAEHIRNHIVPSH